MTTPQEKDKKILKIITFSYYLSTQKREKTTPEGYG